MPATVVVSEQVNDPSVKGLQKCFDPKCKERLDSDSCDGVVGCYWCVRDKYDAPLDEKYCADINKCYGGREGRIGTLVAQIRIYPFAPGNFAEKCLLKLVKPFLGHCLAKKCPKRCLQVEY